MLTLWALPPAIVGMERPARGHSGAEPESSCKGLVRRVSRGCRSTEYGTSAGSRVFRSNRSKFYGEESTRILAPVDVTAPHTAWSEKSIWITSARGERLRLSERSRDCEGP